MFFADSDLIIHPNLINHLISLEKQVVSEIFWTKWTVDKQLEPNVWLFDEYDLVPKELGEELDKKQKQIRRQKFLNMLKSPGVYEVGGLGACTLISKEALLQNLNFAPIKNLTIWGEDRFFCIRAAVLGIELFVDTHYPAYHIYRECDLSGVENYVNNNEKDMEFIRKIKAKDNKITLSMIVKNESKRYLQKVLESVKNHISEAVIIDDGSTDNTIDICKEILKGIPLNIITNEQSLFAKEHMLRKKQWEETAKTNPDWVLVLDADEIIEDGFWEIAQGLIDDKDTDMISLKLYDMWNENDYREDEYWEAHNYYRPFLVRYHSGFNYQWNEKDHHCGRLPMNMFRFSNINSNWGIKHFGWAKEEDRLAKFKRYKQLDPDGIYGIDKQYDSILDTHPTLKKWEDGEK